MDELQFFIIAPKEPQGYQSFMKNLFNQKEKEVIWNPQANNIPQNESLLNVSMLNFTQINEFPESNLKKSIDFLPFFEIKKNDPLHFVAQNKISLHFLLNSALFSMFYN